MSYYCELCNYKTQYASNYCIHKKTKKHLLLASVESKYANQNTSQNIVKTNKKLAELAEPFTKTITLKNEENLKKYICKNCDKEFKHDSSYYRHLKICNKKESVNELKLKLEMEKREKELYQKLEKEKSEMLNNFMANANNIINNAQNNTKVTAEAIKSVSISALKYANDKFKNAPALLPLENFNINNLDFNNEDDKIQLTEILVYHAKQKSLDKLLGDHIIKEYKKDNPEEQSFHTTDSSRLNYIVRELIENALIWSIDKSGIKICSSIVKPLIEKCINLLLEYQKILIEEMTTGDYKSKETVTTIISVLMSIDKGSLENEVIKYIAPFFNLSKNNLNN